MIKARHLVLAALAVAAIQIGILVSMIAGRAAILRDGAEIVLKVEPVDPRDLLRGDYVILSYNISLVQPDLFENPAGDDFEGGPRDVFVRLAPDADGFHEPVLASLDRPPAAEIRPGEVDIRGRIRYWSPYGPSFVEYGIERYYVPEGEGLEIEQGILERDFVIKAAVAPSGAAQIRSLHDGDRLLYAEPWY